MHRRRNCESKWICVLFDSLYMTANTLNLAIFVSGRGSNLEAISFAIQAGRLDARIAVILSSSPEAPALEFGKKQGIPGFAIPSRKDDAEARTAFIVDALHRHGADFIALAGYLHLLETEVVRLYGNRIVNIHPALLPAFGGKGMYGHHVHEAVIASGAKLSGATVHIVNEEYDRGPIVAQRIVRVMDNDTPDSLAARVLQTEHSLYPEALQLFAEARISIADTKTIISGTPPALYPYEESTDQRI